jgi:hypothetical protein
MSDGGITHRTRAPLSGNGAVVLVVLILPFAGMDTVIKGVNRAWDMETCSAHLWRIALIAALGCWFLGYIFALLVVAPVHNPFGRINGAPAGLGTFYGGTLFRFPIFNPFSRPQSSLTFDEHFETLPQNDEAIIKEFAFEKMKLSYIAGRKIAMYKRASYCTLGAAIIGAILIVALFIKGRVIT